jgi:hypothetical protein
VSGGFAELMFVGRAWVVHKFDRIDEGCAHSDQNRAYFCIA